MHSILISALAALSVLPYPSLSFTAAGPNGLSGRDGLVAVSAASLESFAQRYGLDWDCLKIANPQREQLQVRDLCAVPVVCCQQSCTPPFCNQRPECLNEPTPSASPSSWKSTSATCTAIVTGTLTEPTYPVPSLHRSKMPENSTPSIPKRSMSPVPDQSTSPVSLRAASPVSWSSMSSVSQQATTLVSQQNTSSVAQQSIFPVSWRNTSSVSWRNTSSISQQSTGTAPVGVIGGTTIPVGNGSTAFTETDGSTIVVGPSVVAIGSDTVQIPTPPTTIATEGETLTFTGEVRTGSSPTGPTSTGSSGSGVPLSTPVITPPPSGTPSSIPTSIPPESSPVPETQIILQGETYMLPWTGTIDILQSDGTTVTLGPGQIVSGAVTLSVPAVSSPTSLSSNGLTINAQPGPVGTSSSGGLSGFAGLINALEGLASSATSNIDILDQISDQGVLWAAGSVSDASFSASVNPLLSTAISDLSSWASTMNGVFEDFNDEVYEMTEDGLRRIFPARNGAIQQFDILQSLRKLTTNLVSIRSDVITKMKQHWIQGTAVAAALAVAEEALRNFGNYTWDNEKPQPVSSSSTSNSTTVSARKTKTSTSSTSSTSATASPYVFWTKEGTDPRVFQSYIKTLPDRGQGLITQFPNLSWQTYVTNLTAEQAQEVSTQSFVEYILENTVVESYDFGAVPDPSKKPQKRTPPSMNYRSGRPVQTISG